MVKLRWEIPTWRYWRWEFWYLLTVVSTPSQLEVPRAWKSWYFLILWWVGILISSYPGEHAKLTWISMGCEFWYLFALVSTPSQLEVPWGLILLSLLTLVDHSKSTWSSMGVGILISSDPCWPLQVNLKFHGLWILISSDPCWPLRVNLKFHGRGNFDIFLPWWALQVNLKFQGNGLRENLQQ